MAALVKRALSLTLITVLAPGPVAVGAGNHFGNDCDSPSAIKIQQEWELLDVEPHFDRHKSVPGPAQIKVIYNWWKDRYDPKRKFSEAKVDQKIGLVLSKIRVFLLNFDAVLVKEGLPPKQARAAKYFNRVVLLTPFTVTFFLVVFGLLPPKVLAVLPGFYESTANNLFWFSKAQAKQLYVEIKRVITTPTDSELKEYKGEVEIELGTTTRLVSGFRKLINDLRPVELAPGSKYSSKWAHMFMFSFAVLMTTYGKYRVTEENSVRISVDRWQVVRLRDVTSEIIYRERDAEDH